MTEKINVKHGDIVVPGDILAEGMDFLPSGNAIREDNKIISTSLGLINVKGHVIKVIPLSGRYVPKQRDAVIGKVTDVSKYGWNVEIKSPFEAELNVLDAFARRVDKRVPLTKMIDVGEYVFAEIYDVSKQGYVKLSMKNRPYQKLSGGITIEVSPSKIPRIIGKQGSMIKVLKEYSKCQIIVGQNGWVWVKGDAEKIVALSKAIKLIEEKSHTHGLTDKVKELLTEVKK